MTCTATLKRGFQMRNSKFGQQRGGSLCIMSYDFNIDQAMFHQIYLPQTSNQKYMRIFIFTPGAECSGTERHIHNTIQLLLLSNAVATSFYIKMTLQAYQDNHSFVYTFEPVWAVITHILV